ncbi:hypothetical protein B296_00005585 [Ensete ventricosum]|uniref:Retrotransposon gag domain-containing protein n=1 Tax=Ensete ventricosum TaxID=4639 RepID=A0A426Y4B0_ENSVE|nr:hypothetical protein B296_00005585 [Ensete ventricosum]
MGKAIVGMLQAIIPHISQLAQQPSPQPQAAPLAPIGMMSLIEGQPMAMQPTDNLPHLSLEFDCAPLGNAVRHLTSTPRWYDRLPLASIHSFNQLVREFEANFLASTQLKPTVASLLGMRQKEDEPLGPYLTHFTKEIRAIPDAHTSLVIQALMIGIRPSCLFLSLMEQPPMTMPKMLQRANQYVALEALVAEKHPRAESSRGPPPGLPRKRMERAEQAIEDLICRGHLDRYIRKPCKSFLHPKGLMKRQIDVIIGGPATSGDSSSARKAYASAEVQKRPQARGDHEITFKSEREYLDHNDAFVIMTRVAYAYVKLFKSST